MFYLLVVEIKFTYSEVNPNKALYLSIYPYLCKNRLNETIKPRKQLEFSDISQKPLRTPVNIPNFEQFLSQLRENIIEGQECLKTSQKTGKNPTMSNFEQHKKSQKFHETSKTQFTREKRDLLPTFGNIRLSLPGKRETEFKSDLKS